jgi:alpha-glucosidase (family GH31 glycosyl hydrolase)
VHWIPIIEAGIAINKTKGSPYASGHDLDIFLKSPTDPKTEYYGKAWAGKVVSPDWLHSKTEGWWIDQLEQFSQIADFDGIWLDLNEASNAKCDHFCNHHMDKPTSSLQDKLFYVPGG